MTRRELLKGTLEMVVLSIIQKFPKIHGYQLQIELSKASDLLAVKAGTLYPILQRLECSGRIGGRWVKVGVKRRRYIYEITARGVQRLKIAKCIYLSMNRAVGEILGVKKGK